MMKSVIEFRDLSTAVKLGWTDEERSVPQKVIVDLRLFFEKPPLACKTDLLKDTVCYDELATTIHAISASKEFRLLEHLGDTLWAALSGLLAHDQRLSIRVTKTKAPISGLEGGVSFALGHEQDSLEW